jgi:hypothetical protein
MIFLSLFDNAQVEEYLDKRYPDRWVHWFQRTASENRHASWSRR